MLLETGMEPLALQHVMFMQFRPPEHGIGWTEQGRSDAAEQPALVLIISACNFLSSDLKTLLNRF